MWEAETETLHFVDISAAKVSTFLAISRLHELIIGKVYHLDVNTLEYRVDEFDEKITSIALRAGHKGSVRTKTNAFVSSTDTGHS